MLLGTISLRLSRNFSAPRVSVCEYLRSVVHRMKSFFGRRYFNCSIVLRIISLRISVQFFESLGLRAFVDIHVLISLNLNAGREKNAHLLRREECFDSFDARGTIVTKYSFLCWKITRWRIFWSFTWNIPPFQRFWNHYRTMNESE